MTDIIMLNNELKKANEKYQKAQQRLKDSLGNPARLQAAAQEANNAWLEYKRAMVEAQNGSILKTLGDLYGC